MALDIDGFAILQRIGARPSAFSAVATEVAKAARTLVIKQIKHKSTDLAASRNICKTLGHNELNSILDGLAAAQIKTLLNRWDKHSPELKTSSAPWRRQHLSALVDGKVEPAARLKRHQSVNRRRNRKPKRRQPLRFSTSARPGRHEDDSLRLLQLANVAGTVLWRKCRGFRTSQTQPAGRQLVSRRKAVSSKVSGSILASQKNRSTRPQARPRGEIAALPRLSDFSIVDAQAISSHT
jgi:hypothetical protein